MIETDFDNHPLNYKITVEEDGSRKAVSPLNSVVVLPDGDSRLFQRRAVRGVGGGSPVFDTCLVAELDGVRVYVRGNDVVVTRRDLRL